MSVRARRQRGTSGREWLVFGLFLVVYVGIALAVTRPFQRWWADVPGLTRHAFQPQLVASVMVALLVLGVVAIGLAALLAPPARRRRRAEPGDDEVPDAAPIANVFEQTVTLLGAVQAGQASDGYPIATWPDGTSGTQDQPVTPPRVDPAHLASVEDLCVHFEDVCESAVDSLEIACALEWEGINDAAVQRSFHLPDVFSLAEEMYLRVPRRPKNPPPEPDPYGTASWRRPALHGLLYALPAVCYPAATTLLVGTNALAMLVVALLVAWTVSQTVALLGYRRLVPSDLGPARQALRVGLIAGLGIALVVLVLAELALHAGASVFWFSVGEATYMIGSSTLFVLSKERLVFLSLAPALVACAVYLAAGRPAVLETPTYAALALAPLLVVAFGLISTRTRPSERRRALAIDELRAVLPAAAFGFCAAGLLSFPAAAGLHGHGGVNQGVLLATLPISLSMGGAEWCLLWYRRRTRRLLRTSFDRRTFARKARVVLCVATMQYWVIAVLLVFVAVLVASTAGLLHPHLGDLSQVVAYLLLGVAMFLSLSLQALGLRGVALAAAASALTYEIVFREHGVTAQLVACGGLVLVVGAYALLELGAATRHAN